MDPPSNGLRQAVDGGTIRERDARWRHHPGEQYLCIEVAEDRRALLVAGDALAEAAREVSGAFALPAAISYRQALSVDALRDALARWREVVG